jgi:hypothetical protein
MILIAGDSWGCGEWQRHDKRFGATLAHKGLHQYLLDQHYETINLSMPGGSNIIAAQRIDDFVLNNSHLLKNTTMILIFQTEWIRDLAQMTAEQIEEHLSYGYQYLCQRVLSKFYYKLSEIHAKTGITIHLIGGCSDTVWIEKFTQEYPGVKIACQSVTNLLINQNSQTNRPVYTVFDGTSEPWVRFLYSKLDKSDLKLLSDDIDLGETRLQEWTDHQQWFYPDGLHANRQGHLVLFEFLQKHMVLHQ